jgi:hypothetical protein
VEGQELGDGAWVDGKAGVQGLMLNNLATSLLHCWTETQRQVLRLALHAEYDSPGVKDRPTALATKARCRGLEVAFFDVRDR